MVQTVLVAHITARLLELRPGLSVVIKDGGGDDWMDVGCGAAKLFHARREAFLRARVRVRFMGT